MKIRVGDQTTHGNIDGFYTIRVVEIYVDIKVMIFCELNDDPDGVVHYHTYTLEQYLKRIKDVR